MKIVISTLTLFAAAFVTCGASAQFNLDPIIKGSDPLSAAVYEWSNHKCVLVAGTAPQLIGKKKEPSNMGLGTIFRPKNSKVSSLVDIDLSAPYCRPRAAVATELEASDISDHHGVSYTVGGEIKANLKIGDFLNLVDVDLSDLQSFGVRVDSVRYSLDYGQQGSAALSVLKDGMGCPAEEPAHIDKAQMIVTNCIGKLTVNFATKKNISIAALDLKFGQLFSGLVSAGFNANWKREIVGSVKSCNKPPATAGAAAPTADNEKEASSQKTPNTDNSISIPVGDQKIELTITGNNEFKVKLANGQVVLGSASETKERTKDKKAEDPKAPKRENVDVASDCADNVLYTTSDLVIFGIGWEPAKDTILKARAFIQKNK